MLALVGEVAARGKAPEQAITYLRLGACPSGGFSSANGCTTNFDVDTTSFAICILVAHGGHPDDVAAARTQLAAHRTADGGYGASPNATTTNANSTGLALSAIAAMGEDPHAAPWTQGDTDPVRALEALQTPSGGVKYAASSTGPDGYATTQATPGLAGAAYPLHGPPPAPALSPDRLQFGDHVVGTASSSQSVTVSNAGGTALAIGSVRSDGSDFVVTADGCSGSSVVPGASCTFDVAFVPSAPGARHARIGFTSNAGSSPVLEVDGTGLKGVVAISPSTVSYAHVQAGTRSSATGVQVRNTGNAPLVFERSALTGANAGDFEIVADDCTARTLEPDAFCAMSVVFAPAAAGFRSATLSIWTDPSQDPYGVLLSGWGDGAQGLRADETSVVLPSARPGGSSIAFAVGLSNTGRQVVDGLTVAIAGSGRDSFRADVGSCVKALAPGAHCEVEVRFAPAEAGRLTADLLVTGANGAQAHVVLTGDADDAPPVSAFWTSADSVLVGGYSLVHGQVTDDLAGAAGATITFASALYEKTAPLVLGCDRARTFCNWAAGAPVVPGSYLVTVRGVDAVGNAETPGASVTLIVV